MIGRESGKVCIHVIDGESSVRSGCCWSVLGKVWVHVIGGC